MALEFQKPEDDEEDNEVERQGSDGEQPEGDQPESEGADETQELDEDQEHEEVDAQPEKPVSRGERRFQTLANEAKEAREEAARVRRELEEFKARSSQPQERTPTADEMALWPQERVMEYQMNQQLALIRQEFARTQFEAQDTADRAAFPPRCARDPTG